MLIGALLEAESYLHFAQRMFNPEKNALDQQYHEPDEASAELVRNRIVGSYHVVLT